MSWPGLSWPSRLVVTLYIGITGTPRSAPARSSGPGGQSVNTSDSRVELSVDVERSPTLPDHMRARALTRLTGRLVDGVVTVSAQEERSQLANRGVAERKMAQLLREAVAPPPQPRRPTKPTRGSKERRIAGKKERGQTKALRRRPTD